jgi:S1-C subfamily serine protease
MIGHDVYARVRNGVCAVGFITEPLAVYRKNIDKPIFRVIGTGFLIEEQLVITNRHVIAGLMEAVIANVVPISQLFIQFVVPHPGGRLQVVPRMIRETSYLESPKLDIGFIRYKTVFEEHFEAISPLALADKWALSVTEPLAVCGYPYGTSMLFHDDYVRLGPVTQQGHLSAVSPFDTTTMPDEILLDVRTAPGMSGAPIFKPEDGTVVGVHYAGMEATTAFGIPITRGSVQRAIAESQRHVTVLNQD